MNFFSTASSLVAYFYRTKQAIALPVIALCSLLAFQLAVLGYQSHSSIRSAKIMADAIRAYSEQENVKIYVIGRFEYSLPYYLQRHITVVNFKGNMEFGIGRERKDWLQSEEVLMPIWLASNQALALLSLDRFQQ